MLWYCENHGHVPPTVSQPMYNLLARGIEQEYLAFCKAFSVAVVPYNPLAGGLLTGKHVLEAGPAQGTRFDGNELYLDRYWHPEFFEAVTELQRIAERAGLSLPALAFRWLLSQPLVDSVILGVSSKAQFDDNLKACRGSSLSEDVLRECDAVWEKLRGVAPRYNR
jgi:aryl-alcohol dehydrogenase-like predicted oxidoreductase